MKNTSFIIFMLFGTIILILGVNTYIYPTISEHFSITGDNINEKTDIVLKEYENISSDGYKIYENVDELLNENPNIKTDNNVIVNYLNRNSGMGSVLTCFMQNGYYLNTINPTIISLPYYNTNNEFFKYSEDSKYNNSFFLYFKYKHADIDISKYKMYFTQAHINNNLPFISRIYPVMSDKPNKQYIDYFNQNFEIIKNDSVIQHMNALKSHNIPLIGIHIRSRAQNEANNTDYLSLSINDRLNTLKKELDNKYTEYTVFVMTDVAPYIDYAKQVFTNVQYFENVMRIDSEDDSVPLLDKYKGYKLGSDILNECTALSLCDKIYIASSNIPFIICLINPNIEMEQY